MAAPNIVGVTTVTGKTTYLSIPNTSANVLLSNAASSNSVYKVNSIIVANDSITGSTTKITVTFNNAASGGGTAYNIAKNVGIASESTLVIMDKASSIYLEENNSIVVTASASDSLDVICSYEEII
jgi:hypothetical protein